MENPSTLNIILSCEHASNVVPPEYESLFTGAEQILNSHRGWDPGAYSLASGLSKELGSPLFSYPYTRLLIEPNRSAGHPKLFSGFSRSLSKVEKNKLMDLFYIPYRNRVKNEIQKLINKKKRVLHLSVHSFTPELDGDLRNFEIGILYDPKRKFEKAISRKFKKAISVYLPDFRVRMNRPYKGASDGFTTFLRQQFGDKEYLGLELEVNQKNVHSEKLPELLALSIREIITP